MNIEIYGTLKHAIMIASFVFVMMLIIEYINVQTKGLWIDFVSKKMWKQYLFAALLGIIPGCLGAFTAVALFSHRMISFGAIVTTMIATSGDEAYVMFSMFPKKAILLTFILFVLSILAGYITDKFYRPKKIINKFSDNDFSLHEEGKCKCFDKDMFWQQLIHPSIYRFILVLITIVLLIGFSIGWIAGNAKLWIRISIILVVSFSMFIAISVPDDFLEKHLWDHIVKKHLVRIFLWTFGTLFVFSLLMNYINVELWISSNMFIVLLFAVLIGIIPESGPHLIFVTLFAQGTIPFSILLASSIVQDGHGMLPLLAESKRSFIAIKIVNMIYALIVGIGGYLLGF
ncbi:MAG: putative manganese transporter [Bacteroidota bacterium]|nr:putative manganese transporter [Bacteroidota bacterium]